VFQNANITGLAVKNIWLSTNDSHSVFTFLSVLKFKTQLRYFCASSNEFVANRCATTQDNNLKSRFTTAYFRRSMPLLSCYLNISPVIKILPKSIPQFPLLSKSSLPNHICQRIIVWHPWVFCDMPGLSH
jgi:hypothetical protein